jgi:hypothetical protein
METLIRPGGQLFLAVPVGQASHPHSAAAAAASPAFCARAHRVRARARCRCVRMCAGGARLAGRRSARVRDVGDAPSAGAVLLRVPCCWAV